MIATTAGPMEDLDDLRAMVAKLEPDHMSRRAFDSLGEYSCSMPTGTTVGKVWKRNLTAFRHYLGTDRPPVWVICEYVQNPTPGMVGIVYRRPLIAPIA